jgi:2-dehydropantoate 2-reductase
MKIKFTLNWRKASNKFFISFLLHSNMKILFIGAGVIGSYYASAFHAAGIDTTIFARGKRLEEIRQFGIRIYNYIQKTESQERVPVIDKLDPSAQYDVIFVIMRKNKIIDVLPAIAANKNKPDVVFLGNNGTGFSEYEKGLPLSQIVLGFPAAGGQKTEDRIISVHRPDGEVTLGEQDGKISPRLQRLAEIFGQVRIKVSFSSNIDGWLKYHIVFVAPLVAAVYQANGDNYAVAKDKRLIYQVIHAIREGIKVLQQLGYSIEPPALAKLLPWPDWMLRILLARMFGSEKGRLGIREHAMAAKDEMCHIAHEFLQIKARSSIETPTIDELYRVFDVIQK